MDFRINAVRPHDVAREVERLLKRGAHEFVLEPIAHGGMLDQERLGAARYAAGLQAEVKLAVEVPAAAGPSARRR
ncbi:MAG: hypothetical protein E6I34_11620 [Chloroflexi bacterium]|nr:MAG: hypothetical protein E6I34_11620 [Chloroflexota bacterium]